jgi:hypothetical protein
VTRRNWRGTQYAVQCSLFLKTAFCGKFSLSWGGRPPAGRADLEGGPGQAAIAPCRTPLNLKTVTERLTCLPACARTASAQTVERLVCLRLDC